MISNAPSTAETPAGVLSPAEVIACAEDRFRRSPFRPPLWLREANLQTIWSPLFRRQEPLALHRQAVSTPDGDELSLYRAFETGPTAHAPPAPLALLLHGLEATLSSNYLAGTARKLLDSGFDVAILMFRSCDGRPTKAPRLYHSGETTDLDLIVRTLAAEAPRRPIVITGVSLGANVLLKWLGENGAPAGRGVPREVQGAAVTSPPFDLEVSGPVIDRAFFGIYARRFLRTLVPKALAKADQFPDLLDRELLHAVRTIEDFDNHATAVLHGFDDAWDYWRTCGSVNFLAGIDRPTLLVAARDDPFNPASTHPVELIANQPVLVPAFTDHGGHVGFVLGSPWRTRHWAEEQVVAFCCDLVRMCPA